jgi:hypothetical protein
MRVGGGNTTWVSSDLYAKPPSFWSGRYETARATGPQRMRAVSGRFLPDAVARQNRRAARRILTSIQTTVVWTRAWPPHLGEMSVLPRLPEPFQEKLVLTDIALGFQRAASVSTRQCLQGQVLISQKRINRIESPSSSREGP